MDIVPLPTSSNIAPAIQPTDIVGANPANYSPAPALAALQDAFQKGMVTSADILPIMQSAIATNKAAAISSADILAANLRKQVQPAEAQAAIAQAGAAAQVAPV